MQFQAFVGGSYISKSSNIADEECINFFAETNETAGAQAQKSYLWTPGISVFATIPAPTRGACEINGRVFFVGGRNLVELASDGTQTVRASIANDGLPVSIVATSIQLLIVSGGQAYCYTLATDVIVNVTSLLAGIPLKAESDDTYFVVSFSDSNKYQTSAVLDGTTWPGLQVNEVSVFPENIRSILCNHRELWVFGNRHIQPYQDTGSDEIFDVIPGALIEIGCAATFSPARIDNSIFWISEDERGGRMCWRATGYTPQRISTHAVEWDLSTYANIENLVSYAYQDGGHLFWLLYIPGSLWSWTYDVGENLWHKRAEWNTDIAQYGPHYSWNHVYAFGKHLVGDWNSGNVYELSLDNLDDNGAAIRRVRQAPTLQNELERMFYSELRVNFDTGLGPQPPLVDGDGNARPPQAMLQWSNDGGHTWSNEHWRDCGFAGEYGTFVRWQRLGFARRRIFRLMVTDPIQWSIVDASFDVTHG